MPLYHIVPITARVAFYIVIHQDKRHEILHVVASCGTMHGGRRSRRARRPCLRVRSGGGGRCPSRRHRRAAGTA
eukprot:scaffold121107_cov45-Phaeocystis_antarctica.AAC.1